MSIVNSIIKKIDNKINRELKDLNKYTIIKYDISNYCCTSQDNNDFIMSVEQLSYKDCIAYLFKEVRPYLDYEDDEDLEDDDVVLTIISEGLQRIMDKKRLCIYNYCECGLEYFIFDSKSEISVNNQSFREEEYSINEYISF